MHNFRKYHHKKLDTQRIMLQKIWNYLRHFSICYGFLKLEEKLKSNMIIAYGNKEGIGKKVRTFEKLNTLGIEAGTNLNEARAMQKRRRFGKNPSAPTSDGKTDARPSLR